MMSCRTALLDSEHVFPIVRTAPVPYTWCRSLYAPAHRVRPGGRGLFFPGDHAGGVACGGMGMTPPRPLPTRVIVFIDAQNLYHRCLDHFGSPWAHPMELARALVDEDRERYGRHSHVLSGVRFYTGIHDRNRRPDLHGRMARRLDTYRRQGVHCVPILLRYDRRGRARQKGVDSRIALDLARLGWKGLYDVAIIASEDSDLDPAAEDVYELRDRERWVAVENALPWTPNSHARWLPSVRRRRPITRALFERVRDDVEY